MSEDRFKEAKSQLAYSQQLVDQMRQQEMPQEEPMDEQAPTESAPAVEEAQQPLEEAPVQEEPGLVQTIKDTLTPFMDKITDLLSKKEEEPKEVTVKMDGELTPKE